LLTLDDNLLKGINDYHFDNRIVSRSEAVRQLIKEGLNLSIKPKSKKDKT
jgi:metal-responsive CopG/Arc/MetJ family transcriptional regulator